MNTKHLLTAILFFAAIFLLNYSGQSQSSSDSIIIKKKWGASCYYKNNVELNKWEAMQLLSENETAAKLLKNSNNFRHASYLFAIPGSVCVGYVIGYVIAKSASHQPILSTKITTPLIVGASALIIGVAFEVVANDKARQAIYVYNNSKRQNNTTLNLGLCTNGMMIRFNF